MAHSRFDATVCLRELGDMSIRVALQADERVHRTNAEVQAAASKWRCVARSLERPGTQAAVDTRKGVLVSVPSESISGHVERGAAFAREPAASTRWKLAL